MNRGKLGLGLGLVVGGGSRSLSGLEPKPPDD